MDSPWVSLRVLSKESLATMVVVNGSESVPFSRDLNLPTFSNAPVSFALNSTVAGAVLLVLLASIVVVKDSRTVLFAGDVIVTSTFAVAF